MVTLQSLLDEFEAARDGFLDGEHLVHSLDRMFVGDGIPSVRTMILDLYPQIVGNSVDQWANADPYFDCEKVRVAARRHIIARDFQEFNPQRADMLWRLQSNN